MDTRITPQYYFENIVYMNRYIYIWTQFIRFYLFGGIVPSEYLTRVVLWLDLLGIFTKRGMQNNRLNIPPYSSDSILMVKSCSLEKVSLTAGLLWISGKVSLHLLLKPRREDHPLVWSVQREPNREVNTFLFVFLSKTRKENVETKCLVTPPLFF